MVVISDFTIPSFTPAQQSVLDEMAALDQRHASLNGWLVDLDLLWFMAWAVGLIATGVMFFELFHNRAPSATCLIYTICGDVAIFVHVHLWNTRSRMRDALRHFAERNTWASAFFQHQALLDLRVRLETREKELEQHLEPLQVLLRWRSGGKFTAN